MKQYAIGIDIGSTCAKAVVLDAAHNILDRRQPWQNETPAAKCESFPLDLIG